MNLLLSMQKKYRTRDEALKQQKEKDAGRSLRLPQSDEYYLLKKHKWVMLTNVENINYNAPSRWDRHFRYYMDTYAYEEHFFQMDSSLRKIRDLKEKYIRFNANCAGDERKAASELDALIAVAQEVFLLEAKALDTTGIAGGFYSTKGRKGHPNGTLPQRRRRAGVPSQWCTAGSGAFYRIVRMLC